LQRLTAYDYKILERRRALSKVAGTSEPSVLDSLKPKKSLSPYILFASAFQKNTVGSVGESAKAASAEWKEMSSSQKQEFIDQAEHLRSQQDQKLAAYMQANKASLEKALTVIKEVKREALKKLSPKKPKKKVAKPKVVKKAVKSKKGKKSAMTAKTKKVAKTGTKTTKK
jgi:hypothetical protein